MAAAPMAPVPKAPAFHLAFNAGTREQSDTLAGDAPHHGWTELFPETYPHAGGPGHFAAYLVNSDGYEVELIAAD